MLYEIIRYKSEQNMDHSLDLLINDYKLQKLISVYVFNND